MKFSLTLLLAATSLPLSASLPLNSNSSHITKSKPPSRIVVENRVLAEVNDEPISVMDVVKKMDSYFYRDYPHLTNSDVARYQFYKEQWKSVFNDMVNNQLVCQDAQSKKIEVSRGDIRQELDRLYGPDIITNLDKIGLTFDEAWEMVETDIYVRRMMGSILYFKGAYNTPPEALMAAYKEYAAKYPKPDYWTYRMISFKGDQAEKQAQQAQDLIRSFESKSPSFSTLKMVFKERLEDYSADSISFSDEFHLKSEQVSDTHKAILESLAPNSFSSPQKELSRSTKKPLYRIFYLADFQEGGKVQFREVEDLLKETLIQSKVGQELETYISDLRLRNGLNNDFESSSTQKLDPFKLQ